MDSEYLRIIVNLFSDSVYPRVIFNLSSTLMGNVYLRVNFTLKGIVYTWGLLLIPSIPT